MLRKPLTWVVLALLGLAGGFALYWFQPWKLVTDQRVDETLSRPLPLTSSTPAPAASSTPAQRPQVTAASGGPRVVAQGAFVTHEHGTSGTARIVQGADGARRLEFVGLDTSNGPDLRVWLSDQKVIEGRGGWFVFDDGKYHELGRLKGNKGNQVYEIPAGLDLTPYQSVSIWCKRFAVSFGAAPLSLS